MLRPQDKIGLVSYASNAQVLLAPISGDRKEEITDEVKKLKASGLTAGGAGIKLGYKQARKNMIKDGQNHLIIIQTELSTETPVITKSTLRKTYTRKTLP